MKRFLDILTAGEMSADAATKNELVLTSLLAESRDSADVLRRTLAAYHKRETFTPQVAQQAREQITTLKQEFLQQPNVPDSPAPWASGAVRRWAAQAAPTALELCKQGLMALISNDMISSLCFYPISEFPKYTAKTV